MTPKEAVEAIASKVTIYEIGQMEENEGHESNDHSSMEETFDDIKEILREYCDTNGEDKMTWGFYLR